MLYAAALRRSEAVGLSLGDLTIVDGPDNDQRLRIRLRGTQDQPNRGRIPISEAWFW
ncbi:hypothetical protein ACIHAX_16530 [Nocardia sp. NPDC051929]|uniref:hypothetical protein n=1 Tax=Nocardia sp. NPDC051929 TaxID=3364327 RepID=UPI0037CA716C